jgi:hypothetical protein
MAIESAIKKKSDNPIDKRNKSYRKNRERAILTLSGIDKKSKKLWCQ